MEFIFASLCGFAGLFALDAVNFFERRSLRRQRIEVIPTPSRAPGQSHDLDGTLGRRAA